MASSPLLGGKVLIESVPLLAAGEFRPDLARKRLQLPQGDLAQIHNADDPIRYLAAIELKPGSIRGNHVHRIKREFLYLTSGRLRLVLQDCSTQETATAELRAGDLVLIPPGIAHALCPLEPGLAVEFSPTVLDPSDTERHVLVSPASAT